MLFKNKEELQKYIDDRAQDIEDRLFVDLLEEQGKFLDMNEIAKRIALEIEKETKRILEVAEIGDPSHVPKHKKLIDLEMNERDDRTWDRGRR